MLTDRGLGAAVEALVSRSPLPVESEVEPLTLPAAVEAAAYYVVAEALTNVVKYAQASSAVVRIARDERHARGRRSATTASAARIPTAAAASAGLADRVAALDGSLSVESAAGQGTAVRAEIPIAVDAE